MASVQGNGITIEYEREGSGEPLLLIMGLGAQLTAWPPELVSALHDHGFETIRFDNRDAGLSTEIDAPSPNVVAAAGRKLLRRPIPSPYTVDDMADDAAALLEVLDLPGAHVVGVSMGGMIAQSLAINHPHRVRSLASIMSSPGDGAGAPTAKVLMAMARRPTPTRETNTAQQLETFRLICGPHFDEDWYRTRAAEATERSFRPGGFARQTAAIMASPDRVAGLERLDLPALVIHGMVDPLARPSGGTRTAKAIPGCRLLMFPDMGHDLPAPRLGEIADAIATNARRAE